MGIKECDARLAKSIVDELVSKGIKVLALDFDKTIVDVHTAGYWRQPTSKLVEHVRPCFEALMTMALESALYVCVVTYSMQPTLIRDVLRMALPKCDTEKIIIRASSKDWVPQNQVVGPSLGKQQHIAWLVTELFNKRKAIIEPQQILLMDDDEENCTLASQFGHQAYEVPEQVGLNDILTFVQSLNVRKELPVVNASNLNGNVRISR